MKGALTPGKFACFSVVVALIGNELTEGFTREIFTVTAIVVAAIGLMLE